MSFFDLEYYGNTTVILNMKNIYLNLGLIVASFVLSSFAFFLVNDPEGPNLLIVVVLAIIFFIVLRGGAKLIFKK